MTESTDLGRAAALRSPGTVVVDNVIRRSLRVADPTDPRQLARALLDRFAGDAEAIRRERAGTPIQIRTAPPPVIAEAGAGRAELAEAQSDLDCDLDALVNESQIKDIQPELRGWASAIRAAARDGVAYARLALGAAERDRAFAARRALTDYARLSRYLAALTGCVPGLFCRLAQSCDNMGALILVTAGEALAAGGVTSTSVILQSASSELQVRRETVLSALRALQGSAREVSGQRDWPRGVVALRQLHRALEDTGATDLRAYLDEGYLANVFDEMIALVSGRDAEGMRALGATSVVTVAQLERFLRVANGVASPESPPLTSFLAAIQYFIDAFGAARSGHRLVFIARPPLLFYGLYGMSRPDGVTELLLEIIQQRGRFAEALDCFCCCCCDEDAARILVIGGKALYDIDRAIDLLAQAPSGFTDALLTALAYGFVVRAVRDALKVPSGGKQPPLSLVGPLNRMRAAASTFFQSLPPTLRQPGADELNRRALAVHAVLCAQIATERSWIDLVTNMSAKCNHDLLGRRGSEAATVTLLNKAIDDLKQVTRGTTYPPCGSVSITIPRDDDVSLEDIAAKLAPDDLSLGRKL
ncbi:hypothetical protein [Amaricoccus solimangrovi]|uniref:Uncharacterized protein n=1 Tax=Amaricoccus solimangrovi TaxID=2589815 RepID=A0A501WVE2_9RHOB|nr:hypothetical protein [Amaricoccus solimangrovi]TPE53249.1 hypothetical protein FJM51_04315 [Amaricoccus solimangrovi]